LAGLQFTAVFDVVGFLQIVHSHFVHFRDGRERFSARNSVHVAFDGGMRRRYAGSGSGCWGGVQLLRLLPWPSMRELLLQFENLLRKCVDLGVLFFNLFLPKLQVARTPLILLRAARDSPQKQSKARKSLLRRK
jgi:hypothetical protein